MRATVSLSPRLRVKSTRCDNSVIPGTQSIVAKFTLDELLANVAVPVNRKMVRTRLKQVTAPNWDRCLVANINLGPPSFHPPLLLSSRTNWHLRDQWVEVFDRAYVIDGAKRLEAALVLTSIAEIPVTVVFGLDTERELALRQTIEKLNLPAVRTEISERIDTDTPRLKIGESWIRLVIQSDPFVVPTWNGYTPAILVRRDHASQTEHVLCGAKSLVQKLEEVRKNLGRLKGSHISVRKQSAKKTSPYCLCLHDELGDSNK